MHTPRRFKLFGLSSTACSQSHPTPVCNPAGSQTAPGSLGKSNDGETPTMPVAVRDLAPLLVDAYQSDRTWLKDFGQENIHVSAISMRFCSPISSFAVMRRSASGPSSGPHPIECTHLPVSPW